MSGRTALIDGDGVPRYRPPADTLPSTWGCMVERCGSTEAPNPPTFGSVRVVVYGAVDQIFRWYCSGACASRGIAHHELQLDQASTLPMDETPVAPITAKHVDVDSIQPIRPARKYVPGARAPEARPEPKPRPVKAVREPRPPRVPKPAREPRAPREPEHGKRGTYAKGCRCEPCCQANRDHAREQYRRTHVPRFDVPAWVKAYEDGATIPAIAAANGTLPKTVRKHLRDAGVTFRDDRDDRDDRAGHSGSRPQPVDEALAAAVRRLYLEEQLTQAEVADRLKVTTKVVQTVMRKAGIPARPPASVSRAPKPQEEHGASTYKRRGCRCDVCTEAMRVVNLAQRRKTQTWPYADEIRDWAVEQGIPVPARGPLPDRVRDAYVAVHQGPQP